MVKCDKEGDSVDLFLLKNACRRVRRRNSLWAPISMSPLSLSVFQAPGVLAQSLRNRSWTPTVPELTMRIEAPQTACRYGLWPPRTVLYQPKQVPRRLIRDKVSVHREGRPAPEEKRVD